MTEARATAAGADQYFLTGLSSLGVLFLILLYRGTDIWALFPALIGVVALVRRWELGPAMVLLALMACGYHQEESALSSRQSWLHLPELVASAALVVFSSSVFRLRSLKDNIFPIDPRQRRELPPRRAWLSTAWLRTRFLKHARSVSGIPPEEIALLLLAAPAWALAAQLLSAGFAREWASPALRQPLGKTIITIWTLGGAAFLFTGLIGYWGWRIMNRREAALFLEDTLWRETRREQRRQARWLVWSRLRKERR